MIRNIPFHANGNQLWYLYSSSIIATKIDPDKQEETRKLPARQSVSKSESRSSIMHMRFVTGDLSLSSTSISQYQERPPITVRHANDLPGSDNNKKKAATIHSGTKIVGNFHYGIEVQVQQCANFPDLYGNNNVVFMLLYNRRKQQLRPCFFQRPDGFHFWLAAALLLKFLGTQMN